MIKKTRQTLVFHPLLFAAYSILGVYSQNASQVPVGWIIRPLVFLILLTIVVYVVLQKIFNDREYSGFVTTLLLNWLFMGHFYRFLLQQSPFWRTPLGGLCAFLLVSVPLGFFASPWVWNRLSKSRMITTFLNVASLALIMYPAWITMSGFYEDRSRAQIIRDQQSHFEVSLANPSPSAPDIYLIVVDGYGRADILRDLYEYDNAPFVEFLKEQGFYVADQATSNYPQTNLSLSSMLNLQYLNEYTQEFRESSDHKVPYELIQHPVIRRLLKDQGYTFVALPSATLLTQIRDADLYFNLPGNPTNEFEALILSSTVIGVTVEAWGGDLPVMGHELHRDYLLFSLDKLPEVTEIPGPKFVFAHIMLPHPPFIFNKEGEFVLPNRPYIMWDASLFPGTTTEYQQGYTEQMTFLNQELTEIVSDILARSPHPPVILLQGDHGPGAFYNVNELHNSCLSERFSILNAYYFPDGDYRLLYPSVTPVNSFRIILNQYFGAELEVLEDRSYFASWTSPYLYTDVTDQIDGSCQRSAGEMR